MDIQDDMIFFVLPQMVQFFVTEAVIPEYLPVNQAFGRNDETWIQRLRNSQLSF